MRPKKSELILDAGYGSGEITNAFRQDGFNVVGFDASEKLINRAKERYGHDAFFYVHPHQYSKVPRNFEILIEGGKLYLLDKPDYTKREHLHKNKMKRIFTGIFPVYDANNSGFWVKERDVANNAHRIGFSRVEEINGAAFYRNHMVLEK